MFEPSNKSFEELQKSPEFIVLRFLNNLSGDLRMKCQEIRDILNLLQTLCPGLSALNTYTVVETRLRVLELEAQIFWNESYKLVEFLSNALTPTTKDSQNTMQPSQPSQHPDLSSVPNQDP